MDRDSSAALERLNSASECVSTLKEQLQEYAKLLKEPARELPQQTRAVQVSEHHDVKRKSASR